METCDLRLYSVEESLETPEEKTHETVCANDKFAAGGGPDIEHEGANPTHEEGSPDRADGAMRRLEDDEESDADGEDGNDGDDGEEGEDGDGEGEGETPEGEADDECTHGSTEIEKSPEGFGSYVKVKHSDVAFMRMGFFNHIKLNTDSMIHEFFEGEWYTIDLLLDWDEQTVSIYADGEGVRSVPFFTSRATKL